MVINVNVQYNGGRLPDIILLTICDYIGEPFKYHEELLSLRPMFPPKAFDMLTRFRCVHFCLKHNLEGKNVPPVQVYSPYKRGNDKGTEYSEKATPPRPKQKRNRTKYTTYSC